MSDLPSSVTIMEVGPRDGLQIEPVVVSTEKKVDLVERLAEVGLPQIEVGSFVNPKAVPQMADSEEVFNRITMRDGTEYHALWLNVRGLQRALENGRVKMDGKVMLTVSDAFSRRNTNKGIDETLAAMPMWIQEYQRAGLEADELQVPAAFGCNFEGFIPAARVVELIGRAAEVFEAHGCRLQRVTLADTMGWGTPDRTRELVGAVRDCWPEAGIRLHLHDTRATAIANVVAALEMGVTMFDAAIGGLGGCPFAGHKGAAGNVCTEDLVFVCEEMGASTGVDLDGLIEVARYAEELVGHPLPGKLMKSGSLDRFRAH